LGVGASLLPGVEVEPLAELVAACGVGAAAQPCEEVHGLAAGENGPELAVARHVGQAAVPRDGVGPRVAAEHPGGAAVVAQQAEQGTDGRRLAGAVGAEEAVHLAPTDLEVET